MCLLTCSNTLTSFKFWYRIRRETTKTLFQLSCFRTWAPIKQLGFITAKLRRTTLWYELKILAYSKRLESSYNFWCVPVLVARSCLNLCNPVDCSQPGSPVHGIHQVRILEWIANPFSKRSSLPRDQTCVSCIADTFCTI